MPMTPITLSFEQFAARRGVGTASRPTASHIRSTAGMSTIALRRAGSNHQKALDNWIAKRDALWDRFEELIEQGLIMLPTRIQRLQVAAQGHPDLASTKIAQRMLQKEKYG